MYPGIPGLLIFFFSKMLGMLNKKIPEIRLRGRSVLSERTHPVNPFTDEKGGRKLFI